MKVTKKTSNFEKEEVSTNSVDIFVCCCCCWGGSGGSTGGDGGNVGPGNELVG